jgi:alpha-galactosidase
VLRYDVRFTNLKSATAYVQRVSMAPWVVSDDGKKYTAFRVNQWVVGQRPEDFNPLQTTLDGSGNPVEVYSGAAGQQCSWLVLRDEKQRGLFLGWEFDGRARTTVRQYTADGYLQFASNILDLNHPVGSLHEFSVPPAFMGLFHGDWDEAGYRTQRFVDAVLAKPAPDAAFPYVSWDTWGYQTAVDEIILRKNAQLAAQLGVELFVVDLGWARAMGDWRADPKKFPTGLRALSDYVHSLGMRFGLHFALGEAAPDAPVLQANPDWTSSESYNYFGAQSLCLSNKPAKEWLIEQAVRMIDDYNIDWILQDGENMVKECTKTSHTHDPLDSNYSNAVDGLNAVMTAIQQRRPYVSWENCENGGSMMTFNMVRNYVTSITNDASGSLSARRAAYGATYPFPLRYADRYMPEQELNPYVTQSYIFGGPWVMMNRLPEMSAGQFEFLAGEIRSFKSMRGLIAKAKVYHLTQPPAANRIDAIQSYDGALDTAVAVVTRDRGTNTSDSFLLRPRGLRAAGSYRVWFEDDPRSFVMSGSQLMRDGVTVSLPAPLTSEIVHVDPRD